MLHYRADGGFILMVSTVVAVLFFGMVITICQYASNNIVNILITIIL